MKKLTALMLMLALLLGACALAEGELPYVRELEQYGYYNATLLSEETYPQVCLMGSYPFWYYNSMGNEPLFLCFPGPAGAQPASFASYWANYLDMDNMIVYGYEIHESDSFEEFLNKCEADEYIVMDGSDGMAAYIDPSDYSFNAYGMLYARDFGKSAKLVIRIRLNGLDNKMPMDTRVTALTEAITAEVNRVQGAMHTETFAPYWSYGKYAGAKILDENYEKLYAFDFQDLSVLLRDGGEATGSFALTKVDGTDVEGIYGFGDGLYAEVKYSLESYSFPAYKLEENDEQAERITLDNGSEWLFYSGNRNDDGSLYAWYASKVLDGVTDNYDKQMYFNLQFSGSSVNWANVDACKQIMAAYDANLTSVAPQDDPYVAPEKPAEEAVAPSEEAGEPEAEAAGWTCADCGTENTGNFCTNCGAARPEESAGWTCPDCGTENTGNFCANCGAAKP